MTAQTQYASTTALAAIRAAAWDAAWAAQERQLRIMLGGAA